MYQVIARKFRPQRFEDVVGQDHVTSVIKNAIDLDRLPHAFIFSGPRGVGKTSMARILAKAINCEKGLSSVPCNTCSQCEDITASRAVDVFEIDAASHTGVDDIRDLIENARYAPSSARFKTFIIDEVHMLSRNAFNALLKTLEEPPSHVIFIMATTELAKVPVTVLSRCQRYDFRRIAVDDIVAHLKSIASHESIDISDDAMITIALQADGSMRDAQGMLEHMASSGIEKIDMETVESMLGLVGRSTMHDLITALVHQDVPSMLDVIDAAYQYGQDLGQLYRSLLEQSRNMMVIKAGYSNLALAEEEKTFLKELVTEIPFEEVHRIVSVLLHAEEIMKFSTLPKIALETILLRIISAPRLTDLKQVLDLLATRPGAIPVRQPSPVSPVERYKRPPSTIPLSWDGFLRYLNDHDQPLYAILANTRLISEQGSRVVLACTGSFFADQLTKALPEITKRAQAFLKNDVSIEVEVQDGERHVNKKPKPSELRSQALKTPVVKELISEFDGALSDVKPRE
ncbi:MAG TPA: DNA polymerase III subunit gamma/tau [Deltaproteobacteria bacterium]|nr:DNA polymerase III subunit gamma/tau [Deltaproteobacteria bacterium]